MATTDHDFYDLLGVPRDADDAAIKKAFRRLARELHPDVSSAPDAEARFREVTEAYEVLSNSETRARLRPLRSRRPALGRLPADELRPRQPRRPLLRVLRRRPVRRAAAASRRRGADVGAEIEIELVQAARGEKVEVPFEVAVACGTCGGDGVEPGTETPRCPRCDGTGRLQQVTRSPLGQFVRTHACPQCAGRGVIVEHPCHTCTGAGVVVEERQIEVDVPAGIHDGQRIRLSGEGHAGDPGGRAGDVYVLVHVKPDPRFVREGNDIYSQVDLTIVQAALGATMRVETLEGEIDLELAAGVQPGESRVLRGKGMPVLQGFGRGDHRVLVNVTVPRRLTDEQRRLLEEFEAVPTRTPTGTTRASSRS